MEQIPFDDPQDAAIADNVLQHLRHALQLLASPAQVQLSHFPVGWVVLTDEMVLDKVSVSERFLLTFGTTGGYTPIESKISPQEGG
jgi:hypothetical protein